MKQFIFIILFLQVTLVFCQSKVKNIKIQASSSYAVKEGYVPSLKATKTSFLVDRSKRNRIKKYKKAPKNFHGRGRKKVTHPERAYHGLDIKRQKESLFREINPLYNIEGLNVQSSPHDPSGFAGENHYVQVINLTEIGIYDLEGNLINSYPANNLWTAIGRQSAGDPCVLYDEAEKRWIITEFPRGNEILIAVSADADPTGAWSIYKIGTPTFPDYPKTAIWKDYLTITTNEEGAGVLHSYLINKPHLYSDSTEVKMQRIAHKGVTKTETGFFVLTPIHQSGVRVGDHNPMFLRLNDSSWGDIETDGVDLYSVNVNWENADLTTTTQQSIALSPFDSNPCSVSGPRFSCIPQKDDTGSNAGVDGLPEVIMHQSQYRKFDTHESIVFSFITDVTGENHAGIRWVELRNDTVGWKLYQEGTFSLQDSLHRFMPSIAMDIKGNIALAYNASSKDDYIGLRATGRLSSDPLGEMTFKEYTIAEGRSTNVFNTRQGDYAHMTVDPGGTKFYFTSEYMGNNQISQTKIFAFQLEKEDYDHTISAILSPQSGDNIGTQNISIELKNTGKHTLDSFDVSYSIDGNNFTHELITDSLSVDSTMMYTFSQPFDFDAYKTYMLTVASSTKRDTFTKNDTIRKSIKNIATYDLALSLAKTTPSTCADSVMGMYQITNNGRLLAQAYTLEITQDDSVRTIHLNDTLITGQKIQIPHNFSTTQNENTITATLSIDDIMDEIPGNNVLTRTIIRDSSLLSVDVVFNLDLFPQETSWTLYNSVDSILGFSPTYVQNVDAAKTRIKSFCLQKEACYKLEVKDVYGDGICCNQGNGNFQVLLDGKTLLYNNGEFGSSIVQTFCVSDTCLLTVKTASTPASSAENMDGTIIAYPSGGMPPYTYSIDGFSTKQSTNRFTGLSAGRYIVEVHDKDSTCLARDTIAVTTCDLTTMYEVTHPSGADSKDGKIALSISTPSPLLNVSMNGDTLPLEKQQTIGDLGLGTYIIHIMTQDSCTTRDTIRLETPDAVEESPVQKEAVIIMPNPTKDVIKVVLQTPNLSEVFIPIYLYDAQGALLKDFSMTRYDDKYIVPISLYTLPAGSYYLKIVNGSSIHLKKVIKI